MGLPHRKTPATTATPTDDAMSITAIPTPPDKSNDATGGMLTDVVEAAGCSFLGFTTAGGDADAERGLGDDGDFNGDGDEAGEGEGEGAFGAKMARGRSTLSTR